jgi:hypothetical protein
LALSSVFLFLPLDAIAAAEKFNLLVFHEAVHVKIIYLEAEGRPTDNKINRL